MDANRGKFLNAEQIPELKKTAEILNNNDSSSWLRRLEFQKKKKGSKDDGLSEGSDSAFRRPWIYENSSLEDGPESLGSSFSPEFKLVIPEGLSLRDYLMERLKNKMGKAVAIEFGGVGSRLFSDFGPGVFKKTAGVSLTDSRNMDLPVHGFYPGLVEEDEKRGHSVLTGDILNPATLNKVKDWLGADKADIIIEKMGAGLQNIPPDIRTLTKLLKFFYSLLASEGDILIKTPIAFNDNLLNDTTAKAINYRVQIMTEWEQYVNEEFKGVLDVEWDRKSTLRITKLNGAPDELPMLPFEKLEGIK